MAQIAAPPTYHFALERPLETAVVPSVADTVLQSVRGQNHPEDVCDVVPDSATVLVDGVFLGGQRGQEARDRVETVNPAMPEVGVIDCVALGQITTSDVHDARNDVQEKPEHRETS